MQISEILLEKTLEPASFYQLPNLQAFIKRLTTTGEFIDDKTHKPIKVTPSRQEIAQLKKAEASFPPEGIMLKSRMKSLIPTTVGGIKLNTIFREPDFGGKGGFKGKEADLSNPVKLGNVGPAVEAWKAIGLFARLTDRSDNPITLEKLMSIKNQLNQDMTLGVKKGSKSRTDTVVSKQLISVPEVDGNTKDTISIKINVALGSWQRAMAASPQDKELWGRIQGILAFVNENNALKRYNKLFSQNHRIDPVKIAVVGGEGEKTDIKTMYLDPQGNTKDILPSLSFSLKATSPKIGQSSGTTVEGVKSMFATLGLDDTAAMEAIKAAVYAGKQRGSDETDQQINARYKALHAVFNIAGQQLEQKLSRATDTGEANFLEHFFSTLTKAMTGGANMVFVDFNANGTYKKLNPKTIKNLASLVDLEARVTRGGGAKGHPYLFVYDKNSNKNIMHIRLEVQTGGRLTLHYELDDLINLAIEANNKSKDVAVPAAPPVRSKANKPVATNPKPALKVSQPQMGQEPVDDIRFSGE
jgi:hypothetical protein